MQDHLNLEWDAGGTRTVSPAVEATLRFATALVQDGMSGVTVVVPRAPGVLMRARMVARRAGVSVLADNVGSAMITMRFSGRVSTVDRVVHNREPRSLSGRDRRQEGWRRLVGWLVGNRPGAAS